MLNVTGNVMKKTVIIIICAIYIAQSFAQTKPNKSSFIKNATLDLKKNEVASITEVFYKLNSENKKKNNDGIKTSTTFYDTLGRETESMYFDSLGLITQKTKQYYANNEETSIYRTEIYNSKGELENVSVADTLENGTLNYILHLYNNSNTKAYYELYYNNKGLIIKGILCIPSMENPEIIEKISTTKLIYTFRQ